MAELFFNGPAGRIEAKYNKSTNEKAPVALILHPHPQYGGNMNNKVVYNIYKTLGENNCTVMRINFRGVGNSEGQFDDGIGEMIDASTALDWLQNNHPLASHIIIAGFSFGAWIAMQLIMRRPEISNFISIAPPVNKYDFSFLSPCPIGGVVIQGDRDSVVLEEDVSQLTNKLSNTNNIQVDYRVVSGADHFFRERIDELNEEIGCYVKNRIYGENQVIDSDDDDTNDDSLERLFI